MIYIGMDVHQKSTTFCLFDPSASKKDQYRTVTRPTTVEGLREVLHPHDGACQVAFEVGTQAQWVARIVRPLASDVQVANPSRIPWLFRDGRKNNRLDARSGFRGKIVCRLGQGDGRMKVELGHGVRSNERPSSKNEPASQESHVPPLRLPGECRMSTNGSLDIRPSQTSRP